MPAPKGAKRKTAIAALLSHPSYAKAATDIGVAPETISDWLKDEEFRGELEAAADAILDGVVAAIKGRVGQCFDTLLGDLGHKSSRVRHGAADKFLNHAQRLLDLFDQRRKLAQLEEAYDALLATGQGAAAATDAGRLAPPAGEPAHALPGPATDAVPLP